ncbi:MAG TPA: GNAT family N-acetyltransferase [Actinomycetales bacterium]|nr:GNAT family N-acetyltransferase [Actinomycetales bacterium]
MQRPSPLSDGVVLLRPPSRADLDDMVGWCRDEEVVRWTVNVPVPYERHHAEEFLARVEQARQAGTAYSFVIETAGRPAGQLSLRRQGSGAADIGFLLAPPARGKGLMSRALRLLLTWAFDELRLEVVHWRAIVGNWTSRRVAWACGFQVEGRVRGLLDQRGTLKDGWIGSLQAGDAMRPATPWLEVPRLEAGRVVLRRNDVRDVVRIVEACRDPQTQRWLPDLPRPYTFEDAIAYLESLPEANATGEGVYWAVADAEDEQLLAQIGLMGMRQGRRSAEIGYWSHPDARGSGVVTTAVRLVARHALLSTEDGGLGLSRVQLRVARGNEASARVAEKAGFTASGVDRQAERLRDGSVRDFLRYDLLVDEMEQAWAHPSALR